MNCKQIKKIIIESSLNDLNQKTKSELTTHLSGCSKCANVYKTILLVRDNIDKSSEILPSDELQKRTIELCHEELANKQVFEPQSSRSQITLPKFIWVTITLLLSLTIFWIFSVLIANNLPEELSIQNTWAILLISQNILMLILSPILLKKYDFTFFSKKEELSSQIVLNNKYMQTLLTF